MKRDNDFDITVTKKGLKIKKLVIEDHDVGTYFSQFKADKAILKKEVHLAFRLGTMALSDNRLSTELLKLESEFNTKLSYIKDLLLEHESLSWQDFYSESMKKIVMDSNSIRKDGFKKWEGIEISTHKKQISNRPGVYVFRQKAEAKMPYTNSDIVKIGETNRLDRRIWQYMRKSRTCDPEDDEQNRRTAWKVRHFIRHLFPLEFSFIDVEDENEAERLQNEMIEDFEEECGGKPLLEGSIEEYRDWCRRIGVDEETLFAPI